MDLRQAGMAQGRQDGAGLAILGKNRSSVGVIKGFCILFNIIYLKRTCLVLEELDHHS